MAGALREVHLKDPSEGKGRPWMVHVFAVDSWVRLPRSDSGDLTCRGSDVSPFTVDDIGVPCSTGNLL